MANSLIVTISDDRNYGNRLQNYALTQMLSKYGHPTTAKLAASTSTSREYYKSHIIESLHLQGLKSTVKSSLGLLDHNDELQWQRLKKMKHFTKQNMPTDRFELTEYKGLTAKAGSTFDTVVLGSDQIWNPNWFSIKHLQLCVGSFAKPGIPIISYAASFGVSVVENPDARAVFSSLLPRLSSISVREDAGKELVRQLSGRDAMVVLDPTLMLSANNWKAITRSFVPDGERYVLTYFLGKPSATQEECIQRFANEHHCRIRRILDFRDPQTYIAGVEDFVELFAKAQYVFTDSFHACCFSILFEKQFTVFSRSGYNGKASMNSRMETLFRLFELNTAISESELAPSIDYSAVNALLEQHRHESQTWLDAAMGW